MEQSEDSRVPMHRHAAHPANRHCIVRRYPLHRLRGLSGGGAALLAVLGLALDEVLPVAVDGDVGHAVAVVAVAVGAGAAGVVRELDERDAGAGQEVELGLGDVGKFEGHV